MVLIVRGWASTSAIDAADHSFAPDAIRWPNFNGLTPPIELLYGHDRFAPAGKIRSLTRRCTPDDGLGLWCEASVDPRFAGLPFTGFSVKTRIDGYVIKTSPRPHAVVTSAILLEVSLVKTPCNPQCTIQEREDLPEVTPFMIESINRLRAMQRLVEQLQRANQ